MFNAFQGFLSDHRGLLVVITAVAWVWFVIALKRHLAAPAVAVAGPGQARMPGRVSVRKPVAPAERPSDIVPQQRTSTGGIAPQVLAPGNEKGIAEHNTRSAAATAKLLVPPTEPKSKPTESLKTIKPLPPTSEELKAAEQRLPPAARPTSTSGDDEAMDGLFAGLKDKTTEGDTATDDPHALRPGTSVLKRVNRLEEIGFHHQIPSDKLPAQPAVPPETAKPRSQSAELDDILKRIDKVLADNPAAPAADQRVAPVPGEAAPKMATTKPDSQRIDPSDVLKRIDQALAESHGNAAEVTMMDPDWADEAKRAATEDIPAEAAPASKPLEASITPAKDKPADAAKPAPKVPDWARSDIQDEDLKSDKDPGDGKGGPSQQKLF